MRTDRASCRSRPPSRRSRRGAAPARPGPTRPGAAARWSRTPRRRRPAAASSGAISRVRGGQRPGERRRAAAGARSRTAVPDSRSVASQNRELGPGRLLLADQRAAGRCAAGARGRRSRGRGRTAGERWPASRSSASRRSDGEPATSSISSGANRTVRRTPASAAARRGDAVDADPLAGAAGRRADEGDLDDVARPRAPSPGRPTRASTRASSWPQRTSSPSAAVRCDRPHASEHDRLEQAGLAGGVRAPDQLRPRVGRPRRAPRSRAGRGPRARAGSGRRSPARRLSGPGAAAAAAVRDPLRQEVVRTGITTCT